ncbi:MAG TPA: hypothetical protein VK147_03940 [Candidatus Didemnitutus sp.]|nr:hypothetical protein [Candidatus Didemnitutus sp.]
MRYWFKEKEDELLLIFIIVSVVGFVLSFNYGDMTRERIAYAFITAINSWFVIVELLSLALTSIENREQPISNFLHDNRFRLAVLLTCAVFSVLSTLVLSGIYLKVYVVALILLLTYGIVRVSGRIRRVVKSMRDLE